MHTDKTSPKKLFYVDDDVDDLAIFEDVAVSLGALPVLFSTVHDLLETLRQEKELPFVIFTDLNMPCTTGYDLLRTLKEDDDLKRIPVVVLSTAKTFETLERCFALGASIYMTKATNIGDIQRSLKHILELDWIAFSRSPETFRYRH